MTSGFIGTFAAHVLNQPNIAHIHGLEKSDGAFTLVMELIEGPTLADRITKGAMPIDEALPIAKQIAEAIEAAHQHGSIHRDLKPANIKVRSDGTVKVLDFGLAKAMEPMGAMSPNVSQSPTITTPAMMTGMGVILGTAAYMAPEQAKGRAADTRSDVWTFGCVLYEMLTGHARVRRRRHQRHARGRPARRTGLERVAPGCVPGDSDAGPALSCERSGATDR